jgi:hypothetical protein
MLLLAVPPAGDLAMWLRLAAHGDPGWVGKTRTFTRIHAHNMRHGYYASRVIGDYRQQHLAFKMFFERKGPVLDDAASLARLTQRSLAREMTLAANRSFYRADEPTAARLAALARMIDPSITRRSVLWWRAAMKRALGWSRCQMLASLLAPVCGRRLPPRVGAVRGGCP